MTVLGCRGGIGQDWYDGAQQHQRFMIVTPVYRAPTQLCRPIKSHDFQHRKPKAATLPDSPAPLRMVRTLSITPEGAGVTEDLRQET